MIYLVTHKSLKFLLNFMYIYVLRYDNKHTEDLFFYKNSETIIYKILVFYYIYIENIQNKLILMAYISNVTSNFVKRLKNT